MKTDLSSCLINNNNKIAIVINLAQSVNLTIKLLTMLFFVLLNKLVLFEFCVTPKFDIGTFLFSKNVTLKFLLHIIFSTIIHEIWYF